MHVKIAEWEILDSESVGRGTQPQGTKGQQLISSASPDKWGGLCQEVHPQRKIKHSRIGF